MWSTLLFFPSPFSPIPPSFFAKETIKWDFFGDFHSSCATYLLSKLRCQWYRECPGWPGQWKKLKERHINSGWISVYAPFWGYFGLTIMNRLCDDLPYTSLRAGTFWRYWNGWIAWKIAWRLKWRLWRGVELSRQVVEPWPDFFLRQKRWRLHGRVHLLESGINQE